MEAPNYQTNVSSSPCGTTSITKIDGSVLEGGGQVLRIAMSLSTLLGKPIKIERIRANRPNQGLRPQHLQGVQIAARMCDGSLYGASVSAEEITYYPGNIKSGQFEMRSAESGSISLLIQASVPIAMFALSSTFLLLSGGTNMFNAPPIDHVTNVFFPLLRKFGGECKCTIDKRGYYPAGGGVVRVQISPVATYLNSVNMVDFGVVTHIWGRAYVTSTLPISMAHKMADAAVHSLSQFFPPWGVRIRIDRVKESQKKSVGTGSGIVLFARTNTGCILGATGIGTKGRRGYEVGKVAAEELAKSVLGQYCLDYYTQDQIIIFMALARGKSTVKCAPLTEHTKAAIHVTEILTGAKFTVTEMGKFCLLECEGIGFTRN